MTQNTNIQSSTAPTQDQTSYPDNVITSIQVQGFRSLADVEIPHLPNPAVLIGPNGSGKSNLFHCFQMVQRMLRDRRLNEFVQYHGGADDQLHGGAGKTSRINARISMNHNGIRSEYRFALEYVDEDRFQFSEEAFRSGKDGQPIQTAPWQDLGQGHRYRESMAAEYGEFREYGILDILGNCTLYQFQNIGDSSGFKRNWDIQDGYRLHPNGDNLAAVLYRLKREDPQRYEYICRQIRRVVPNFDRFAIVQNHGRALLRWRTSGSHKVINAHLTSDGTLRCFALITLFNMPEELLPPVILLDSPELGLNPVAVTILGSMIQSLSLAKQIIVATQSSLLVDSFSLNEIIVFKLQNGQTRVSQPNVAEIEHWLEEYSTGQLWEKNVLGGRP